jgi:hypothetical protein
MADESTTAESNPVRLRALAGGAAPDDMVESASRSGKLHAGALKELGSVLRSCLVTPPAADLGQRLSRYCVANEIAEADLGHVIRACRFLIREACSIDLSLDEFAADVVALFGDRAELVTQIRGEYELARPAMRRDLVVDALMKHGNVLEDIDWRVDVVATDRHAARLGVPVAMVTLAYRNAKETDRLTVQLTAEQLARLQSLFGALAQKVARITSG